MDSHGSFNRPTSGAYAPRAHGRRTHQRGSKWSGCRLSTKKPVRASSRGSLLTSKRLVCITEASRKEPVYVMSKSEHYSLEKVVSRQVFSAFICTCACNLNGGHDSHSTGFLCVCPMTICTIWCKLVFSIQSISSHFTPTSSLLSSLKLLYQVKPSFDLTVRSVSQSVSQIVTHPLVELYNQFPSPFTHHTMNDNVQSEQSSLFWTQTVGSNYLVLWSVEPLWRQT